MRIVQLPSVSKISALAAALPAATEPRRYIFSPGRLNAGRAEFQKRPEAANGEAKNSRFRALNLKYQIQTSAYLATAARKIQLWLAFRRGNNSESVPLRTVDRVVTLKPARVLPNPSLKLSPNGVSRWPSSAGPSAHFALAAQRATPSVPA